jgi:glycosyltransferase involved in cell wall biosynthesis
VVPSSYEGFGIVYLEAMSWALPAIAVNTGTAHEIITHGENGFLVSPDDPAALAQTMRRLLADRLRLQGMRRAARARYEAAPLWAESMTRVREYLLRISATPPQHVLSIE